MRPSIVFAASAALALCSSLPAQTRDSGPPRDIEQLRRLTEGFVRGYNARDVERVMAFYADEYVDVNLREPVQTRAQRREYFRALLATADNEVDVTPEAIIVSGEYAFIRGTIVLKSNKGGTRPIERRYLDVARKFRNGWRSIWGIDAEIYASAR